MNYSKIGFGKVPYLLIVSSLLASVVFAEPVLYEAENESAASSESILDSVGASGGKYVMTSSGMSFMVSVTETANYDIVASTFVPTYGWFNTAITVNGTKMGEFLTKDQTGGRTPYTLETTAKLKVGENTVTFSGGAFGIDYMTVERHPDPVFTVTATPVDPNATRPAKKLMTFLRDNFQKKTISGMMISDQNFNYSYSRMELLVPASKCTPEDSCKYTDEQQTWKGQTDISEFYKRSGHYPALGGFDMLFAAGGHSDEGWFLGYTENHVAMAKELWSYGGIPTFTWHWKVGADTVFYTKANGANNAGCTEGVMGTSADNTCFNFTKAFTGDKCQEVNTSSTVYKDIIDDIDKVSEYFLQLQKDSVAVIWRPIHEASGGWFWWGTQGPDCYISLYRLIYDRMVNVNKVHNLLWVWNINTDPAIGYDYNALNASWYPGDAYVDIVAVDIYDQLLSHNSAANYYNKITADVGTDKIIALSENGAIPDIDSIAEDKAYWSYWMTWSQTWSGMFLDKTSNDMWVRNLNDERIIALDDMPGWENVVPDESGAIIGIKPCEQKMDVSNRLAIDVNGLNLSLTIAKAGRANIALFDMLGNRVEVFANTQLNAGTHNYQLNHIAKGLYVVRAQVGSQKTAQVIRLK